MRKSVFLAPAAMLLLAVACDDGSAAVEQAPARTVLAAESQASSALDFTDALSFKTDSFELPAGKERYLCFTKTLQEDLVIDGYHTAGAPFVHHLIFARNRVPQKDGFEECDEAFRMTWDPVFLTGAGATTLEFPKDAGHKIPKGTQMIVQMHLLNASEEAIKSQVEIKMHRSSVANPRPVNSYVFGSPDVNLLPNQTGQVVGNCKMSENLEIIGAFPHMHMLGTSMTFEAGANEASLKTVFQRDPYSFDSQTVDRLAIKLAPGDLTRVTCKYKNTTNHVIKFGESSLSEMCFLITFAVDRQFQSGCMEKIPPLPGLTQ
ncbi:MAG: hypothetical protein ABW252_14645 [Polyangiales bacterium]